MTIQKDLKVLLEEVQTFRGLVCVGVDDVILTGPKDKIMEPAQKFIDLLWKQCGLCRAWHKSENYTSAGRLLNNILPKLKFASEQTDQGFFPGMLVWGIPVASEKFIAHYLNRKLDKIVGDMPKPVGGSSSFPSSQRWTTG